MRDISIILQIWPLTEGISELCSESLHPITPRGL